MKIEIKKSFINSIRITFILLLAYDLWITQDLHDKYLHGDGFLNSFLYEDSLEYQSIFNLDDRINYSLFICEILCKC